MVKNLSAMQETQVKSLGWEDPLEKEMATHSSILFFFPNYLCIIYVLILVVLGLCCTGSFYSSDQGLATPELWCEGFSLWWLPCVAEHGL